MKQLKKRSVWVYVDLILLGFAKAFDKIFYTKFIFELIAYGIHPVKVKWIKNFSNKSQQMVVIGDHYSCWEYVLSGVK